MSRSHHSQKFSSCGIRLSESIQCVFYDSSFFQFDQGGLSFSDRKFYLGSRNKTYHSALVTYIRRVAELLGGTEHLHKKAEDIWAFETKLAEVQYDLCITMQGWGQVQCKVSRYKYKYMELFQVQVQVQVQVFVNVPRYKYKYFQSSTSTSTSTFEPYISFNKIIPSRRILWINIIAQ